MIFFHDKQWYRPEPLFSVEEEDEEEDEEEEEESHETDTKEEAEPEASEETQARPSSPSPSQGTVTSGPSSIPPSSTTTKKPEYEFLLFNYLLRFVHREGQIGDFARAGVLFLMDVAMSPGETFPKTPGGEENLNASTSTVSSTASTDPNVDAALALAEYILDGDFSEVLAAGLAAVYSLLPSKLEIKPPSQTESLSGTTMVLGSTTVEMTETEKEAEEATQEKNRSIGLEESSSPSFKSRLDHFLKLLEFLQDVLKRNILPEGTDANFDASTLVGSAIVQSILDAVRRVFLENVFYPSILECSDADGSAVAVMSYIEIMMRTLGNGQLGDLLVEFLMSEDNTADEFTRSRMRPHALLNLNFGAPPVTKPSDRFAKQRRRKSAAMALLELEAPGTRKHTEYFTSMGRFTLKDLLLSSLRSTSQSTVTAAFQLLQSLLQQYCKVCTDKLMVVIHDPHATSFPRPAALPAPPEPESNPKIHSYDDDDDDEDTFIYPGAEESTIPKGDHITLMPSITFAQPDTTYWTHEREMGLYLTLVSRVDPAHNEDAFSTGYDHYLRDALLSIQTHPCFHWDVDLDTRAKTKHRLNANDPVLSLVLESLRRFFSNTPEQNMALTGVLATLAVCPDRSLAGWLTFSLKEQDNRSPMRAIVNDGDDSYHESLGDGDDRSIDFAIDEKLAMDHSLPASRLDEQSRPVVHSIFHGLVSQLERYRQMVEHFDQYLLERRQGLLFSENLTDALSLALDVDSPSGFKSPNVTSPTEVPTTPRSKAKQSKGSSFVSFLTPKKAKPKPPPSEPHTPSRSNRNMDASPFGPHYQKTSSIVVEPFLAPAPNTGPWTPAKSTTAKWNADEDDVFTSSSQWGTKEEVVMEDEEVHEEEQQVKTVTLSRLLDNVVILEESIKELVAIIHARRSLGIDSIRYL